MNSFGCDQKMMGLAQRYSRFPNDLGLLVGQGYNMLPDDPTCMNSREAVFQAGLNAGRISSSINPSGMLFSKGLQGLTLAAPNSSGCEFGCYSIRPNPTVNATKGSLYTPHIYDGPKPSVNTVTGMY